MKLPTQVWMLAVLGTAAGCATLMPERVPEQDARLRLDRGLAALDAGRRASAFEDLAWVYSRCEGHETGTKALLSLAGMELDPRNRGGRPELAMEFLGQAIREPGTPRHLQPLVESAFLTGLALGAPRPGGAEPEGTEAPAAEPLTPEPLAAEPLAAEPEGAATDTAAVEAVDTTPAEPVAPEPAGESPLSSLESLDVADDQPVYGCGDAVEVPDDWVAPPLPSLPGPSMAALLSAAETERAMVSARADTLQTELNVVREQLQATREELERIRATLRP